VESRLQLAHRLDHGGEGWRRAPLASAGRRATSR
jgi:hypothetical protein